MSGHLAGRLLLGAAALVALGAAQAGAVTLGDTTFTARESDEARGRAGSNLEAALLHDGELPAAEHMPSFDAFEGLPARRIDIDTIALGYRDRTAHWAALASLQVQEPQTLALLGLGLVLIAGFAPGIANRRAT